MSHYKRTNMLAKISLSLFLLYTIATQASEERVIDKLSIGFKVGQYLISDRIDTNLAYGFEIGYAAQDWLDLELRYNISQVKNGRNTPNSNVDSVALTTTTRSKQTTYALIKAGIHHNLHTLEELNNKTSLLFGVGAGVRITNQFSIESEFSLIDENQTYFGLNARMCF